MFKFLAAVLAVLILATGCKPVSVVPPQVSNIPLQGTPAK